MSSGKQLWDFVALSSNVFSSVGLIFANKWLMGKSSLGFQYATTLCALHYLTSFLYTWSSVALGFTKKATMPWKDLVVFTATANVSIASLNMSLMLNKVGFYQIAKLSIVPFVCLVERFWLGKHFSRQSLASVATVILGVAIVTLTDLQMADNTLGLVIAAISVVTSGLQQIFCRELQKNNKLSGVELLSVTAPAQGFSLMLVGPFLDYGLINAWVLDYRWTTPAAVFLFISCFLAVGVNLSQFVCLGRVSAVTYQVVGHSKTILVLLGSSLFLGEVITPRQGGGMIIAVMGMVAYNYTKTQEDAIKLTEKKGIDEEQLLPGISSAHTGDALASANGTVGLGSSSIFRSTSASDLKREGLQYAAAPR